VDNYLHPFSRLNLKPKVINVQPMALVSLLDFQGEVENNIAVIDIGASATQITIANKKNIMLSRTIDTGGTSFTNSIMDVKDIDFQQAEEDKTKIKLDIEEDAEGEESSEEDYLDSMPIGMEVESEKELDLTNLASRLSSEITRSLDFFNMKNRDEEVEKIFITGGGSRLQGLKQIISEEIGREIFLIDPFKNIKQKTDKKKEELIEHYQYEFAVAVGLAVSEVIADES